jgi:anti-sigma regulatory factor (Ser/Thr protein kinase)
MSRVTHQPVLAATLPPTLAAPRFARNEVLARLHERHLEQLADEAALLTSELVTNAVIHAHSSVDLELYLDDDHIHVSVVDHGEGAPRIREPDPAGGGQGLRIVDSIADQWGHEPLHPFGKRVWFDLQTTRCPHDLVDTCDDSYP